MHAKTVTEAALRGLDNIGSELHTMTEAAAENGARNSSHPYDPLRPAPTPLDDQLLTVHDAARFLNVTISWVYEHTRRKAENRLPFVKLGKYIRFDPADLRAYVDHKRRASGQRDDRR